MTATRKNNHWITIDGEQKILADWAREYGLSVELILDRIKRGWTEERAIVTPARKYRGVKAQDAIVVHDQ